jgi:MFS family permease
MTAATVTEPKPRSVFALRDFRLLWFGQAISALGDQFTLVALPWLALLLTGDPFALGTVLALMSVPRAVLMLIGGAYVDRLSPRRVMILSNIVRLGAVSILGGIVLAGGAQLWMLYAFALVFGVADAFFYPATTAIVPELVEGDALKQANAVTQGTSQLTVLIGPALAGVAIAVLGTTGSSLGTSGVGVALLLDGLSFLASIATLLFIHPRKTAHEPEGSVIQQIAEGIRFVWQKPALRIVMLMSMLANLVIVGPLEVGLPVLAYQRLPEGAAAFGLILSAFGGGSLVGLVAASVLPSVRPERFGTVLLLIASTAGLSLAALAFAPSTAVALALSVVAGVALGFTNIQFITWVQQRVPPQLMGRVMSLLVFGSVALVPISMAVAGALVQISLDGVLIVAGVGMTAVELSCLLSRSVRRMGLEPVVEAPANEDVRSARGPTGRSGITPARRRRLRARSLSPAGGTFRR